MYRFCQTTRSSFFYGCSFQDSFIPPSSVLFLLQKCLIWLKNAWNQNANSLYFRTKKLLNKSWEKNGTHNLWGFYSCLKISKITTTQSSLKCSIIWFVVWLSDIPYAFSGKINFSLQAAATFIDSKDKKWPSSL